VQEALSNVARHSGAVHAEVLVRRVNGRVEVVVRDDGQGFAVPDIMQDRERGLGLFGMEERAAYVGGRVQIVSSPGGGTRVEVEIPVGGEESTFDG
ncbi:MAG TPA: ATP-binding protein, partial [Longimicrobiales bacterium]|nr:ATP-binding protein [Longimicrobiales bacterium]